MNARQITLAAVVAMAVSLLALVLAGSARSQVQATPSFVPIGTSSSGAGSTVWFHEPASRQAVACQTVQQGGGLTSIQCVAAKLPS